jgi:5-methylcytosine-specific restriction endonuclease McrA
MARKSTNKKSYKSQVKRCSMCGVEKAFADFHKSSEYGLQSRCKHCSSISKKKYNQDNKKELAAYDKEYWKNHKTKKAEKDRRYYIKNKEELLARMKIYYQNHKVEIAGTAKQYRQTDRGKDVDRMAVQKRRALKAKTGHENFYLKEIFERDGYVCQLCGRKTRPDFKNHSHPLYPNLDHIVPLSKGGPHTKLNTQCLCRKCNMEKRNTGTGDQLRLFGG